MPELIYCAGKNARFAQVAQAAGFKLGAQVPCTVYTDQLYFADQNWKRPDRSAYMAALNRHRPALATALDWEREEQLSEVLGWAEEAAQYAGRVLLVPKVVGGIARLPRRIGGKDVVLAYSVPTRFGGTRVPTWEFASWPVHLLGGSPQQQIFLHCLFRGDAALPEWFGPRARRLYERSRMFGGCAEVVSVDGNMANKMAHSCRFWSTASGPKGCWVQLAEVGEGDWGEDANREAFRRSCEHIATAWGEL